jgi:hypothetical protein
VEESEAKGEAAAAELLKLSGQPGMQCKKRNFISARSAKREARPGHERVEHSSQAATKPNLSLPVCLWMAIGNKRPA